MIQPYKTWWGVRHLRYAWHWYWFRRWWIQYGSLFWLIPSPRDQEWLDQIWAGKR